MNPSIFYLFFVFLLYIDILIQHDDELNVKFTKAITERNIRVSCKIFFNKYERVRSIQWKKDGNIYTLDFIENSYSDSMRKIIVHSFLSIPRNKNINDKDEYWINLNVDKIDSENKTRKSA